MLRRRNGRGRSGGKNARKRRGVPAEAEKH
jgi:hypothetical protein